MNTEAMIKLADHIEDIEPDAFAMDIWWYPSDRTICGTAGCLAGWQSHIGPHANTVKSLEKRDMLPQYAKYAMRDLDLDDYEADSLFTSTSWWADTLVEAGLRDEAWYMKHASCSDDHLNLHEITNKEASVVLRGLADGTLTF